jgi:hypothetical protein
MKKLMLVGVSMLLGSTAWAGRTMPKWCSHDIPQASVEYDLKSPEVANQLKGVAYLLCNPGTDADMKLVDDAYHKLSTRFGLDDAAWADVADWSINERSEPTKFDQKKPWSQLDPLEQYQGVENNFVQASNKMGTADPAYFVDALGSKLTESGRVGWIRWCLNQNKPVVWAMCQPDIDALDGNKLAAELRAATGASGRDRMSLRLQYDDIKSKLAAHAADVKKLIAKDPIYGQMFDIAKKQRTDWKPSADAAALQVAMEDAMISGSRKASDGCADKTWKAVLASVSKIPAKTFQNHRKESEERRLYLWRMRGVVASGLLSEPDSYLAVNAHAMCNAMTSTANDDVLMGLVYAVGTRWSGFRGPRTAAQTRIFQTNLQPDDRGAQIEYPDTSRFWFGDHNNAVGHGPSADGTVTKATLKGATVHIEFQKHKHQEYVSLNCKSTGRIQAIRDNGEIVYEETCADSKLLTTMEGPDPKDVDAETNKAVKAGMVVDIDSGILTVAWPNEKSDTPALVLGQPVK